MESSGGREVGGNENGCWATIGSKTGEASKFVFQ